MVMASACRQLGSFIPLRALSALASCVGPPSYAGVNMIPGGAGREIQTFAIRAQAGDQSAQLESGIRFEHDNGVPFDLDQVRAQYKNAAMEDGVTIRIYSPPVGDSRGQFIPVDTGPKLTGLAEVRRRLEALGYE